MKLTTFYRLKKPEGTDVVNVDDFNDNFDTIDTELYNAANAAGDASESYVLAQPAATRTNIQSGDTFAVIVGKIMKWFSDLKGGAFSTVVNDDSTDATGYVADARIVKTHGDEIDGLNTRVTTLETSFPTGCNTIYNGAVAAGVTPTAKSPSALATAYTSVKNKWIHNDRQGTATAADVRSNKTFTNSTDVAVQGSMTDLSATNFTSAHSSTTAGAASNFTVTANISGYVPSGTVVSSTAAGTSSTIATTSASGTQTINVKPGIYNKISVNQTNAYNAGVTATKVGTASAADVRSTVTFTNSSSVGTQGSMPTLSSSNFSGAFSGSNYNVTSSTAGYVASGTTVHTKAAGTSGTINTTSGSGTQTISITPGVYNKISVNQDNAYNAGDVAGRASGKILSVYNYGANNRRLSVTATLPSGTHTILYWSDTGTLGPGGMHTVTVSHGSTVLTFDPPNFPSGCTYKSSTDTTSSTYYIECPFTLSANTSVTITMTLTSNANVPAIATVI